MKYPEITDEFMEKIIALRHELHRHPELSGEEVWTKQHLMEFLRENTKLEIYDMGSWFYAKKSGAIEQNAIAFRADYDALPIEDCIDASYRSENPGCAHKCGHDGHSAALCGVALLADQMETDRTIYFIFQPAEEVGKGGEVCAEFVASQPISEVYAWHNRPGYPAGQIVIKEGPIQCASKGLTVCFKGVKSHASEPEKGVNPAFAVGGLIQKVSALSMTQFQSRTLYTIIHANVGTKDFGVSPDKGEISFTLRADFQNDLEKLECIIRGNAEDLAVKYGLQVSFEISDPFPETSNDSVCAQKVMKTAESLGLDLQILDKPWRASEDFGYYTMKCPGAMFFIGTGEDQVPLHHEKYDFNDRVLETAMRLMFRLI